MSRNEIIIICCYPLSKYGLAESNYSKNNILGGEASALSCKNQNKWIVNKVFLLFCPLFFNWDLFIKATGFSFYAEAATKGCFLKNVLKTCFQNIWKIPLKKLSCSKGAGNTT